MVHGLALNASQLGREPNRKDRSVEAAEHTTATKLFEIRDLPPRGAREFTVFSTSKSSFGTSSNI